MAKPPRQKNFTTEEEVIIVEEVEKRKDILFKAFTGPGLGKKRKTEAWEQVAASLNSQSNAGCTRNVGQVKKKYANIKTEAKAKASERRHPPTGGGPPPKDPKVAEQMFLDMMGDAPVITGITGGMESCDDVSEGQVTAWETIIVVPSSPVPATTPATEPGSLPSTIDWENTIINSLPHVPGLSSTIPGVANLPNMVTATSYPAVGVLATIGPTTMITATPTASTPTTVSTTSTTTTSAKLFPPPGTPKVRNPRSDKVASDLHIEVLIMEKKRIEAQLKLIQLQFQNEIEEHEEKMELLKLKKRRHTLEFSDDL